MSNQSTILSSVEAEVRRRFGESQDLAHGWDHVDRVQQLALSIGEREGANLFVVRMAALLHDLGQTVQAHEKGGQHEHHADLSLRLANELLREYKIAEDVQQAIGHAILAHSFSRGVSPTTLEARVMRDADRLDALGAIGIMRWAITGAQRRVAQTVPYCLDDPFAEGRVPDDHAYMLDHFFAKLLTLSSAMLTRTGRVLAEQRTAFMRSYLDEFRREIELLE